MTPVDLEISKFQAAARAKVSAQKAFDLAFRVHGTEGTARSWKAKMTALALLTERCVEYNSAKNDMVLAVFADALDDD